ncbi:MAG: hypothetical protein M3R01_09640, partial [Actinomycetota bacterium]|nr:hypothetical protein [Actinomycetota bacterium]
MPDELSLVCPLCRTELDDGDGDDQLTCARCGRCYPIVAGIPDLRLGPDPYLSLADDRAKAVELDDLRDLSYAELLAAYWQRTPEVPASLAAGYAANTVRGLSRAEATLDRLDVRWTGAEVLDVGCGAGGLLQAVAQRGGRVVG